MAEARRAIDRADEIVVDPAVEGESDVQAALEALAAGMGGGAFVGAVVRHSVNQSIGSASWTPAAFDTEDRDTDGFHDTATNNTRLTVPSGRAGTYLAGGGGYWAANVTGQRGFRVRKNGTANVGTHFVQATSGNEAVPHIVTPPLNLAAGDYVELLGFQGSGGALNLNAIAGEAPVFWLVRVGD